LFIINILNKM